MVITEPAEPSAQLLGLGSKQYSSNMQRMFNEDFYSISHADYFQVRKIEHASERKALLVSWNLSLKCWKGLFYRIVNMIENRQKRATISCIKVWVTSHSIKNRILKRVCLLVLKCMYRRFKSSNKCYLRNSAFTTTWLIWT